MGIVICLIYHHSGICSNNTYRTTFTGSIVSSHSMSTTISAPEITIIEYEYIEESQFIISK